MVGGLVMMYRRGKTDFVLYIEVWDGLTTSRESLVWSIGTVVERGEFDVYLKSKICRRKVGYSSISG